MAGYALMDLAKYPEGDDVVEDFIFMKLGQLADEWVTGNDEVVQEHVIAQLLAYRDTLDEPHHLRLARRAQRRHDATAEGSDYREFYAPLK